jgi:hypothetical protein
MALPIPLLLPVTIATLSFNRDVLMNTVVKRGTWR